MAPRKTKSTVPDDAEHSASMVSRKRKVTVVAPGSRDHLHGFEFGGPLGAFGITFGLPILTYLLTSFLCNERSGCPVPASLELKNFDLQRLKEDAGWEGIAGVFDLNATLWVLAYYLLLLALQIVVPGHQADGAELRTGGSLRYKFNSFRSMVLIFAGILVGSLLFSSNWSDFVLWTFMWDNYLYILTANIAISYAIAHFVYLRSFSVRPSNPDKRELALGGQTGNGFYDWFIGRELNPRVTLPLINSAIDLKVWCELRPGMIGWLLLNYAFAAHQYQTYGYLTDSMLLVSAFQTVYVVDALYNEPAILTTMDITSDGFGFMLAFGDLVWVPFIYSLQTRYLAVYPLRLGALGTVAVFAVQALGYYIFRGSNNQKNRFRNDPSDPRVAHLKYINTKSGSRLLVSGWWGTARHINYLGDWIMAWAWCLPTGVAGYLATSEGAPVQGAARGWGMPVTYFYVLYFAVLLVHRERRDEEKCARKYGKDWEKYKRLVRWRMLPGVY